MSTTPDIGRKLIDTDAVSTVQLCAHYATLIQTRATGVRSRDSGHRLKRAAHTGTRISGARYTRRREPAGTSRIDQCLGPSCTCVVGSTVLQNRCLCDLAHTRLRTTCNSSATPQPVDRKYLGCCGASRREANGIDPTPGPDTMKHPGSRAGKSGIPSASWRTKTIEKNSPSLWKFRTAKRRQVAYDLASVGIRGTDHRATSPYGTLTDDIVGFWVHHAVTPTTK